MSDAATWRIGSPDVTQQTPSVGFPATPGQTHSWLFQQLVPESAVHHLPLVTTIRGPLDTDALRRSLQTVVTRHNALRTRFHWDGETLLQTIDESSPQFAIYDLEDLDVAERDRRLAGIRSERIRRPFAPADGPPVRFSLAVLDIAEYELLTVAHRLVADEASLGIFARDLCDCYATFAQRRKPALPAPPFQFPSHGRWLSERARTDGLAPGDTSQHQGAEAPGQHPGPRSGTLSTAENDLRETLADLPDPLELPFAGPRGTDPTPVMDTVRFELPEHLTARLRELADQEGVCGYTATLTAFVVLLHRYTQSRDIVLATESAGRSRPGAQEVIGAFAEPTLLRARLPWDPTWREALRAVRDGLRTIVDREATFQEILSVVRPVRHLDTHPMSQVFVAPLPAGAGRRTCGEVSFDFSLAASGQSRYDLELRLDDGAGYLGYRTEMFTRERAETILGHFTALVEQMVARPDTHLSNLSLLTPQEYDRVVREWNQTVTDYPRGRTITELFEAWSEHAPNALALQWDTYSCTYRELEVRANQLAHHLRGLGVGTETSVGLYFGYTADWVIAALATLKAGGVYVPLDPSYPSERLTAMCADANVKVLLLHSTVSDGLDYQDVKRVYVDSEAATIASAPTIRPNVGVTPDNLAYIMFTSGSTGRAKAIGVTHRNVVRTVCNTPYVDFRPGDVVGQASNISFDASTFEAWGALLNGSRLVGLRREDTLAPDRLRAQLIHHGITIFFLPAALMKQIVAERPDTFSSLRYFFSGGEQADLHTIRRMLRHGPPVHLINPYGPTETTVFAVVYRCNDMDPEETYVPIGNPIGNTTAYVLDPYLQPVPVGVVGELFIGGDGVARGYVGQPDLTAEKFIADPFTDRPGSRLYRTGDQARYRPDGTIDFLGRVDRQVKIRGFRVEPAEIESCLLDSGLLREVSVQAGTDRSGDQTLVAYLVSAKPDLDLELLRDFARRRLPVYMVPGAFVPLESFPLNANGKLDIPALRTAAPLIAGTSPDDRVTPAQERLLSIWSAVLGVDPGPHDDFFALGGDSIQAVRALTRIGSALGVSLPFRWAFEHRTVAALAAAIDELRTDAATTSMVGTVVSGAPTDESQPGAGGGRMEQMLAIWRDVLEVPELGPDDDFFLNGGHSLKVTRVVSRVKSTFGLDVPVRLLFDNRTAREFALALDALPPEEPGSPPSPIVRGADGDDIESLLDKIEQLSDGVDRPLSRGTD